MNITATSILNLHFPIHHSRRHCYKRRRFKPPVTRTRVYLTCTSNLLDPFHNFLSQFPSPISLEFLAPALALASTLPLFSSRLKFLPSSSASSSHVGDWILFTSPTPFNRFVVLRCPSVSFEDGELLENVNERLVQEERHFVRLDRGRILCEGRVIESLVEKLEYQRICVNTEDGGVISLDWPANLELEEEHGLDTTLLLVPGTAEGSMNENIRLFVVEALKHGFFPVVMNPRGCAGSPLTTARLFSAADSDDISTAIQFISKARPWTTLMGVGWGYGANMLTKYLAEVGEGTPLTAVTCINNPFDLEEATRCSPYHIKSDKKLAAGLIDILRANKKLFQGRAKGFDVEKALSAKSLRDFEKAISMVSYGFEEVEEFYSKSSTRNVVGSVKIPVLFIQNDDGTVPLFSIPRGLIAENPFTSLLLCSCLPSSDIASGRAAISWYQNLMIEWLEAVELGLLKGRHPLLNDVDVSIIPTKDVSLMKGRASGKDLNVNKALDLSLNDANGRIIEPVNGKFEDSNTVVRIPIRPRQDLQENLGFLEGLEEQKNASLRQTGSVSAEGEKASSDSTEVYQEETVDPIESDTGQVLQTAQVVMNMLDVSMPGVLSEKDKKKVLTAVGQGETVMKALQDVLPEEVRGKLTTAISGIVNAQSRNFKFDGLLNIGKAPSASSGLKTEIQDKIKEVPSGEDMPEGPHSSDEMKRPDDLKDGSVNNQPGADRSGAGDRPDLHASENAQESVDSGQSQPTGNDASGSVQKGTDETGNNDESDEIIKEKVTSYSDSTEKGRETSSNPNLTERSEKPGGMEDSSVDDFKADQDGGVPQLEIKTENRTQKNEEKIVDSSADQNKTLTETVGSSPSESSPDSHLPERDGSDEQKRDNKTQPALDQTNLPMPDSNSSTFNVVQALDAFTGMDDSTQVAVNSVFGVIEDMISHLEEEKNDENQVKDAEDAQGESSDSKSKKPHTTNDSPLKLQDNDKNELQGQSEASCSSVADEYHGNDILIPDTTSARRLEGEITKTPILLDGSGGNVSQGNGLRTKEQKSCSILLADHSEKNRGNITANPYGDYLHKEHFHRYLVSKIPNAKSLDLDTTTALFLDYFPEEGRWKLLEQPENNGECSESGTVTTYNSADRVVQSHSSEVGDKVDYIEPLYVILDGEQQQEPVTEYDTVDSGLEEMKQFVKLVVLDALCVEVGRRLSAADIKQMKSKLDRDIEEVANAVSLVVVCNKDHTWCSEGIAYGDDYTSKKVGELFAEHVIKAISAAIQDTSCLRTLMPIGVIVGSSLAALRKHFNVTTKHEDGLKSSKQTKKTELKDQGKVSALDIDEKCSSITHHSTNFKSIRNRAEEDALKNISNDNVMVGAVTAALGASAFLVQQQNPSETGSGLSRSLKEGGNNQKVADKIDEALAEKHQSNIVTSFAEKAMSVAGPVVPTKEDGEVDQERLVAMLADLGQKGGMLRLVGKIALLWGGIRGAMSLTDKLISFLHIAERPLYQRILGFVGMVFVLWSPVILPLLPTLVQSWTTGHPSKFAELVIIIGLYASVTILVMIWGRRIRGYEDPLKQYGMDLTTMLEVQRFFMGLVGGAALVLAIQSVNASLGFVSFSWPSVMPYSSLDVMRCLQAYGRMIMLAVRGIITATGVVLVEELLFRSWLPQEVAPDLGYHQGVIISGLAFALLQRSLWAIPGLWFFSLALSGFRQRFQGSLSIPVGFRAGAMASSFIIQTGGFLIYNPSLPVWVKGTHPFQPFTGVVGLAFSFLLAVIVYPREPLQNKEEL